jgi:hypothetical protein
MEDGRESDDARLMDKNLKRLKCLEECFLFNIIILGQEVNTCQENPKELNASEYGTRNLSIRS